MARIRTVKPELFRHEELFEGEVSSGLPLRIAFVGLFTIADREGRFRWRPRQMKLDVLPYDDVDFTLVLDTLCHYGFIKKYHADGRDYGCIPSFNDHQVINNREAQSILPPLEATDSEPMNIPTSPVDDTCSTRHDLAQEERKGTRKEQKGKRKGTSQQEPLPVWLDTSAWHEWIQYRKEIKRTMTPATIKKQLTFLERHQPYQANIIHQSIQNGWTGLFEVKPSRPSTSQWSPTELERFGHQPSGHITNRIAPIDHSITAEVI